MKVAARAARRTVGNGASDDEGAAEARAQARRRCSRRRLIPTALPPIAAADGERRVAISGTADGTGGAPAGVATGVEPAMPDPRIELRPNSLRLPLTRRRTNDSAVKAIYLAYREAEIAAEEHRGRSPRDWTIERNGQKYGLDSQYIYLGKFKIPSAILAALPFNYGGVDGSRIIQARNATWIQNDIYIALAGHERGRLPRGREADSRAKGSREGRTPTRTKATQSPIIP